MKPIQYRFSINGREVNPIYKDDLSKTYELENNQQFFREKLSGTISLIRDDYDWINGQDFNTEFILLLEESLDGGKTWQEYLKGKFMKTDCKWDDDNKKCEISVDVNDEYNDVIAGLDKEYDIIRLAPKMASLTIMKRPLIQVYELGADVLSCFLSGTYWEQDVNEPIDDVETLKNTYYFAEASLLEEVKVTPQDGAPSTYSGVYVGKITYNETDDVYTGELTAQGKNYFIDYKEKKGSELTDYRDYSFYDYKGGTLLYYVRVYITSAVIDQETAASYEGAGTGSLLLNIKHHSVMMRYLMDNLKFGELDTYPIPENDIVEDNRNYSRCLPYNVDLAVISNVFSTEPTEYGLTENKTYFAPPQDSAYGQKYYPIARSSWLYASVWFRFHDFDYNTEVKGRTAYILKDAYLLSSVINVLLKQFSNITHEPTAEYSRFFYGSSNPISGQQFTLLITQKSNILHGEYDNPAQKAVTTLGTILNALRDIYRCYWYIEGGKLKIEHIQFFRNGGSYDISPEIGIDLTEITNVRNGKPLAYLTSNYEYDKSDMPERYQFSWMDDVSPAFEGYPIEIRSKYVTEGKTEEISIGSFTTDIDYMLLNPGAISEDGFALFAATGNIGSYSLPFVFRQVDGAYLYMQNGYLSWITLIPSYYTYDLPAKNVTINNINTSVQQTSREKKQKITFTSIIDPDTNKLIKTYIGNGQVEKITINLCSRQNEVTLKYDTEQ